MKFLLLVLGIAVMANAQCGEDDPGLGDILRVNVLAKTCQKGNAGSNTNPGFCMDYGTGWDCTGELADLSGDEHYNGMIDWWVIDDKFNGVDICDIEKVKLTYDSKDGWCMSDLVVVAEGNRERAHVIVKTEGQGIWFDKNNGGHTSWEAPIVARWKEPYDADAPHDAAKVDLYVKSGDESGAGSDFSPEFRITADGIPYKEAMDNSGVNDFDKHHGFSYEFTTSPWTNVAIERISEIDIIGGGKNDAWEVDHLMVIMTTQATTGCQHYVPLLQYDQQHWIHNDDTYKKTPEPDFLKRWGPPTHEIFTRTIGYWEEIEYSNGDGMEWEHKVSFEVSHDKENEKSRMDEFSQGIELSAGVEASAKEGFPGMDFEEKFSFDAGVSVGHTGQNMMRSQTSDSVSGGVETTCKFARPAAGVDTSSVTAYIWKVYRQSNRKNEGATSETCNIWYSNGKCQHYKPQCLPGFCLTTEYNECLECTVPEGRITAEAFDVSSLPDFCKYGRCSPTLHMGSCCTPDHLCDWGEADCDNDNGCMGNLVCAREVGWKYGYLEVGYPDFDVCIEKDEAEDTYAQMEKCGGPCTDEQMLELEAIEEEPAEETEIDLDVLAIIKAFLYGLGHTIEVSEANFKASGSDLTHAHGIATEAGYVDISLADFLKIYELGKEVNAPHYKGVRSGMSLQVTTLHTAMPGEFHHDLSFANSDPLISDVYAKLADAVQEPTDLITLIYDGRELYTNGRTVGDYGISSGTMLYASIDDFDYIPCSQQTEAQCKGEHGQMSICEWTGYKCVFENLYPN